MFIHSLFFQKYWVSNHPNNVFRHVPWALLDPRRIPRRIPRSPGERSLRSLRGEFAGGAEEGFQGSQGGPGVLEDLVFERYGGFLSHGGTPIYHPFLGIFHEINQPAMGVPPF